MLTYSVALQEKFEQANRISVNVYGIPDKVYDNDLGKTHSILVFLYHALKLLRVKLYNKKLCIYIYFFFFPFR